MAILEIVKYPNPLLSQISNKIPTNRRGLDLLVRNMTETMYAHQGAGLAAIQVGLLEAIFIIDAEVAGRDRRDPPLAFINPRLTWLSQEQELAEEGCLSFPKIYVPIRRSLRCRCIATDLSGQQFETEGSGLYARAIQHEHDHLTGKLLANYIGRLKRRSVMRALARKDNSS